MAVDEITAPEQATSGRACADIMGIMIDRSTRDDVLAQIACFSRSGGAHQIVTVNTDFLHIGQRDPGFVALLNGAAVAVPDGMPLLWVGRLLGQPLPQRITGSDLLHGCAELAAREGYGLFLLGAGPGVAASAAAILTAQHPALQVAGTYSPPLEDEISASENERIIAIIRAAAPTMLFVALGTPKQEKWIAANLHELGVPVCIGVGGVFDFIAGRTSRAPQGWQRLGLEWLYRLLREPRRLWRRYLLNDSRVLLRVFYHTARRRLRPQPAAQYDEANDNLAASLLR